MVENPGVLQVFVELLEVPLERTVAEALGRGAFGADRGAPDLVEGPMPLEAVKYGRRMLASKASRYGRRHLSAMRYSAGRAPIGRRPAESFLGMRRTVKLANCAG